MRPNQIHPSTTLGEMRSVFRVNCPPGSGHDPPLIRLVDLITSSREEITAPEECRPPSG